MENFDVLFSRIDELELADEEGTNNNSITFDTKETKTKTTTKKKKWANTGGSKKPSMGVALSRSRAARSQARLHHRLMEIRILLQRYMSQVVVASSSSSGDTSDSHNNTSTSNNLPRLMLQRTQDIRNTLIQARQTMLVQGGIGPTSSSSSSAAADNNSRQDEYQTFRDEQWKPVLNRHQRELRIRSGAIVSSSKQHQQPKGGGASSSQLFRVIDPTFWDHIQNVISQEQLFHGSSSTTTTTTAATSLQEDNNTNIAIYSDGKLYTNMLQDFITDTNNRTTTTTTSTNLYDDTTTSSPAATTALKTLQLAMQKRLANKKKVDRKASKGRKIRYKVYDKMTHYTFPVFRPTPTISEDQWFPSLFKN